MTTYAWAAIRHDAIRRYGETPGNAIEQRIIDVFTRRPQLVIDTIDQVDRDRKAGKIHTSCWAVVAHRVEHADRPVADVVATDETERAQAIAKAEHWIDRAGLHLPTEHELLDELFGDHPGHTPPLEFLEQLDTEAHGPGRALYGPLLAAAIRRTREHGPEPVPGPGEAPLRKFDTPELRQRMLDRWHERRPDGIHTELDADTRARRWREQRAAKPEPAVTADPEPPDEPEPAAPQPVTADLDF